MPTYYLVLMCDLDGLAALKPKATSVYALSLRCVYCQTIAETSAVLDPSEEEVEVKGGRSTATMTWKCKFCKRDGNLMLKGLEAVSEKKKRKEEGQNIVQVIECRGAPEVIGWDPALSSWVGTSSSTSESEKSFDVDLSQGDWCDFDEEGQHPVSVENAKGTVENA